MGVEVVAMSRNRVHAVRPFGSEAGASIPEYLLLIVGVALGSMLVLDQYSRTIKTEVITASCVIETGGGTAGTIGDDEREGLVPSNDNVQWLACMNSKLHAAGLESVREGH